MAPWTHLVRFIAKEDQAEHLGQLVDTSRDVGKDVVEGVEVKAYLIEGTIFDGSVTETVYTVGDLLSPITQKECSYIRCLGLNYKDHAKEGGFPTPPVPILFTKPRTALAGPGTLLIPKCAQDGSSDYEGELCAVIGKPGRDISEAAALDHVLGYTASNDVSARKMQLLTAQWSFSKGLDGSCPLGPVLVAAAALPDPQRLAVRTLYNGEPVQDGHTRDMIFDLRRQIAYLSQGTTLEAGTVFLTGTPAGIGFFRDPKVVLQDGDDIRVEIEGIGTLVNKVKYDTR